MDRTADVAHYVVSHFGRHQLDAEKLNKIMWRADILTYRETGATITGQTSYRRMQDGPAPNGINDALRALGASGRIAERTADTPAGRRREFVWLSARTSDGFAPHEIAFLHQAIAEIAGASAEGAGAAMDDVLWDEIATGAQIPVGVASMTPEPLEPEDLDWVEAQRRPAVA